VSPHVLQGLREIGDHLGLQQAVGARRLVLSWIAREGLPAARLGRRWYADADQLEAWWASRRASTVQLLSRRRGGG